MTESSETFEDFRKRWDSYREVNGEYAHFTHIFRIGESTPVSEKLPIFVSVECIPVIVKSHTDTDVTLFNMEDGSEFVVKMTTYNAHCQNIYQLDEMLQIPNPKAWKYQSDMFDRAYKACGV